MMSHWTRLSHQELACGKSLLELSVYDGVALWWFNQMEVFEAIRQVIAGQDRTESNWAGMVGSASRPNAFSVMQGAALQIGVGGICRCANRLAGSSGSDQGKRSALLITHDAEWRPIFEASENKTIVTDRFFHPLAKELRSRGFEVLSTSTAMPPYLQSLRISVERQRTGFSRHLLVDGFGDCRGVISRLEASSHFRKVADIIGNDEGLAKMLAEFGDKKAQMIREIILFSFSRRFPDFVKRIDQATLMLLKLRPSVVLIENESGFFQRAVIAAAQSLKVPTVAMQHGEISLVNPAYNFQPGDICDGRQSATCVPIPDLTLVYGPHYKELLTVRSAFPPNRVLEVGNMQYDSIAKLDKGLASNELRKELSIGPEPRLVLWTTQTHAWNQEEIDAASKAVEESISALPQVQLVVKQHPMETTAQKEALQRNLQPLGSRAVFAPKDGDILTLISAADAVITKDSTTGLEAVAAGKPLIVLNLTGMEDKVDYAKQGAAVGVYRPEDLPMAIRNALEGDGMKGESRRVYERRYLLELDGKAVKRAADIVESVSGRGTGSRLKSIR
jgi:phosphohistidine swiveling domain-containing protein